MQTHIGSSKNEGRRQYGMLSISHEIEGLQE